MTYVLLFISLQDTPDLCPKGADLGVKPSAASYSLTLSLYLGLPTEQAENWGTLPGGVTSVLVEIQTVPIAVETIEKIQKIHRRLYGTDFTLWNLLGEMHCVLGQTLTPDSKTRVLGEATTFGDEWFEHETRGKREHEIALLPTRSQAVPITEPLCQMYS